MNEESRVCQCQCVPRLSVGTIPVRPTSLKDWLKLVLKRLLGSQVKRRLKRSFSNLAQKFEKILGKEDASPGVQTAASSMQLVAGDLVRVRSEKEIRDTLNIWKELKGCMFMEAMWQYCGTVQRVLKPVERFVDERDYRVKRAKGLVLLKDLICEGTPDYGRCDRACFYFWRVEWLEKIEES